MVRVIQLLEKYRPLALALIVGAAAGAVTVAVASAEAEAAGQDPAVSMQIQQEITNLRVALQGRLDMMQAEIDNLERNLQAMSYRVQNTETAQRTQPVLAPENPLPGQQTFGRLVSQESTAERFVLKGAAGHLMGQLAMTPEGPGLLLFDLQGGISAALLSTPDGPELRMRGADGLLQTVLPRR